MDQRVRDVQVHYEEVGAGTPLLILHGWGEVGLTRMPAFEPLFENRPGWRRIYPDVAGIVTAPVPTWLRGPDDVLDVLLEFMDAIAPGEPFAVAGVSWGGYVAAGVVRKRLEQVIGVLFHVPALGWGRGNIAGPARQVIRHDPAFDAALRPNEQSWLDAFVVQDLPTLDIVRLSPRTPPYEPAPVDVLEWKPFSFDPFALDQPCRAPALFLMGRQDHIVGYKLAWPILDDYPRGTLAVLDRAGHLLDAEQPALWATLVAEWLDRVEEYAAGRLTE